MLTGFLENGVGYLFSNCSSKCMAGSDWLLQVMEAENTKTRSELLHKETAGKYTAAISRMKQLEKKLKRTINKSK